eukprot:scaffold212596_cov30-Tisochrysis_lutea.AAC.2
MYESRELCKGAHLIAGEMKHVKSSTIGEIIADLLCVAEALEGMGSPPSADEVQDDSLVDATSTIDPSAHHLTKRDEDEQGVQPGVQPGVLMASNLDGDQSRWGSMRCSPPRPHNRSSPAALVGGIDGASPSAPRVSLAAHPPQVAGQCPQHSEL